MTTLRVQEVKGEGERMGDGDREAYREIQDVKREREAIGACDNGDWVGVFQSGTRWGVMRSWLRQMRGYASRSGDLSS